MGVLDARNRCFRTHIIFGFVVQTFAMFGVSLKLASDERVPTTFPALHLYTYGEV